MKTITDKAWRKAINGDQAKLLAAKKIGSGYHLHVSGISVRSGGNGTTASADVTAWNDGEVKHVPIEREEP